MICYTPSHTCYIRELDTRPGLPFLLMLHGFMGSHDVFDALTIHLRSFCNPVLVDLPGHGLSSHHADPKRYETERLAGEMLSIVDRFQFEPLFLYGYSMGGRLAQQMAIRQPEWFRGLLLESSHCGIEDEAEREQRKVWDEEQAKQLLSEPDAFSESWSRLPLFGSDADQHPEQTGIIRTQHPPAMAAVMRGFGAGSMPPICRELASLNLPALWLAGEQDKKYVQRGVQMAELNHRFVFKSVLEAGHRIHLNQPERLAAHIKSFIQRHVSQLENR
ncbi:MAG: alpha/beta fold hydrolase [Balneolaceae bacterium]